MQICGGAQAFASCDKLQLVIDSLGNLSNFRTSVMKRSKSILKAGRSVNMKHVLPVQYGTSRSTLTTR
jgi:archaeosine-15-forming tRNA-guanine transglycosylase